MLNEPNYAICTIERPVSDIDEITVDFVKSNLLFAKELSSEFSIGVDDYSKYKDIIKRSGVSKLKIDVLGEVRIQVNKNVLVGRSKDFTCLISDIRNELTT